ncbi:MAG TPA: OmpA family protein [Kofleriaceae bacterium]|nr:OmpA family protein [Kofleriaceae bacterium]
MKALVLAVLLAACAGTAVRDQTTTTEGLIATARDHGAQKCAPVELAMAESHNDYAEHALDEGNYYDARREADVGATNAQSAIDKSPKDKCVGYGDRDGDGIKDNVDKCPDQPEDKDGFQDEDGCPDLDNDGDGLNDTIDKCPNDPEDKDGFEDEDGCPDPDNDKDGFLDKDDKCPNQPGVAPDGCPKKYNLVVVTEKKIELKQTVFFDFNKATIKSVSFALLNEVAQAMTDNPKIKVEVQGHTDSVGNDAFNLKLSQSRAESVRTYLIKRGVSSDRMVPTGYGENVPIADNRTEAGRSQNRRVEFVITEH